MKKRFKRFLSIGIGMLMLFSVSLDTNVNAKTMNKPTTPVIQHDNWTGAASFNIEMNMWWGNNGTEATLYENDIKIETKTLVDNTPQAQNVKFEIKNRAKGTYEYKLELSNKYGKSTSTTISVNVTEDIVESVPVPKGLTAKAKSDKEITVEWNNVTDAKGYNLKVDGKVIENVTNPYAHKDLLGNSSHTYSVQAVTSKGVSPWSDEVKATTNKTIATEKPTTPMNLKAEGISTSIIKLDWNKVDNAISYEVEVDGKIVEIKETTYSDGGLQPNTEHSYRVRAKNNVGTSDWTSLVKAKTLDKTVPSKVTKKSLIGYWHNFDNGSTNIRLKDVSSEWDIVDVAFPISKDRATMEFKPYNCTEEEFKSDIKSLQAQGKKVLISVGGADGAIDLVNKEAEDKFVNSMTEIIAKYGFDGLDIDFEGASVCLEAGDTDFKNPKSPKVVHLISATRRILDKFGADFMLTMAPETAYVQGGIYAYNNTWGAYLPVIHALRDRLNMIHVQHYNGSDIMGLDGVTYKQGTADFHVAITEMLIQGFKIAGNPNNVFPGLRADQVGIGIPACPKASSTGYTPVPEMKKALDYLINGKSYGGKYQLVNKSGYKDLGGLMTWSINWDLASNNEFSKNYRPFFDAMN